jgi:tRNA threonylcarbamoyl adenosine modification protein YeaZ
VNILAIDTCMQACSAAVMAGGKIHYHYEEIGKGHAERLLPMVDKVMQEVGISYRELAQVAVTNGPGTFTGVRIGVAAARGIMLAANIPAVAASSLHVMSAGYSLKYNPDIPVTVAVDARREQLYIQSFGKTGVPEGKPLILSVMQAVSTLPTKPCIIIGSGASILAEAARQVDKEYTAFDIGIQPDASVLADMACKLELSGGVPCPLYLRPPDAKPQIGKTAARK